MLWQPMKLDWKVFLLSGDTVEAIDERDGNKPNSDGIISS